MERSSCRCCGKGYIFVVNMERNGCINHASTNHFIERKTNKDPRLFRLESCPPWLQFNKFILGGYRCHLSTSQCVESLFYIHNETFNIYSHGKYGSKKNSFCKRSQILGLQIPELLEQELSKEELYGVRIKKFSFSSIGVTSR